jgi:tetratricopeptide (TPR) repeat protein
MALFVFNRLIPAGKFEEAVYFSQLNTTIYPQSIWGWFILGMIFENTGDLQKAYNCFDQLLKIEPCHVEARWEYEKIGALLHPVKAEEELLQDYTGDYDGRKITLEGGHLEYQENGQEKLVLTPVNEFTFLLGKTGNRVYFDRMNNPSAKPQQTRHWDYFVFYYLV